MGLY
jgi:hypothetical protein